MNLNWAGTKTFSDQSLSVVRIFFERVIDAAVSKLFATKRKVVCIASSPSLSPLRKSIRKIGRSGLRCRAPIMRTDRDGNRETRETNVTSGRSAGRRNLTVTIAYVENIYSKEIVRYRLASLIVHLGSRQTRLTNRLYRFRICRVIFLRRRRCTRWTKRLITTNVMISANLCCVAAGALLGWTSPILPKLQGSLDDNPLGRKITPDENSWIGSLVSVGAVIGSFVAGYLAERYIAISMEQSYYLLSRVLIDRPSTF